MLETKRLIALPAKNTTGVGHDPLCRSLPAALRSDRIGEGHITECLPERIPVMNDFHIRANAARHLCRSWLGAAQSLLILMVLTSCQAAASPTPRRMLCGLPRRSFRGRRPLGAARYSPSSATPRPCSMAGTSIGNTARRCCCLPNRCSRRPAAPLLDRGCQSARLPGGVL